MQERKQLNALLIKVKHLEDRSKNHNQIIRRDKQRIQELLQSRDNWKHKYRSVKEQVVVIRGLDLGRKTKPVGYHHCSQTILLSVGLYLFSGCSYRSIVKILLYFKLEWGVLIDLPSKSSISIWVEKLGYYQYCFAKPSFEGDYGLIMDECMVIGQQRLLLIMGISANKIAKRATVLSDVQILGIEVRRSWKAEDIQKSLAKVTEKMGKKPLYVISDGASNLKRGIVDAELIRLCDVSHQMALILERYYKDHDQFVAWSKQISLTKFKGIMQAHAYLLPPKQRVIARFMNLFASIEWSKKMLATMSHLTIEEQTHFQWIYQYESFIDEIFRVFELANRLITTLKINGLSYQSVNDCINWIDESKCKNVPQLLGNIKQYLLEEKAKLTDEKTHWHVCSNIIESLFGKFKDAIATNPLNGVTGMVLSLCLHTHKGLKFDIESALEQVSMADLKQWKQDNLPENQVVKRKKVLDN